MLEVPSIQWFPGHMAKTRRLIQENLKMVDIIVELADARIPQSSRNPELSKWLNNKARVLILNKADTADPAATQKWLQYYKKEGIAALACDSRSGRGLEKFLPLVKEQLRELLERREKKGVAGTPIRVMVVGIPNVGKSSFINKMAGSKRAKVEDRPGVTRTKQWVNISQEMQLLDMPGVLWPKFEDPLVGEKLAFTGAVKDEVIDIELLAMRLLAYLREEYPKAIEERYKLAGTNYQELDDYELLELVGRKRGMLISGGEVNTERAAITVMDEYRSGKLGKLTFDPVPSGKGKASQTQKFQEEAEN